jgi:peptide/nickel transport system ATP-binding protein
MPGELLPGALLPGALLPGALLMVRGLSKTYPRGRTALRDVSFTLDRGCTLGLVGPSGSGKSTLARCLTLFEKPSSGEVVFDGRPLASLPRLDRQRIQLIFQQPAASLNPRFTAAEIVEEPLVIQGRPVADAARKALDLVGLPSTALSRRALEFSGGERQRLAIARALVLEPELLILDESFAGLDVAMQDQIAALLRGLQQRLGLAYLLISHDLTLVADLANEIAVMEAGSIVEQGPVRGLLESALHPLTRALIDAARALSVGGVA